MSSVKIVPVEGKLLKKYIDYPHELYADDDNYVPELYMAQKDLFNRKKNPFFEYAEVNSFLAERDGKIVGRISAILNPNYNKHHNCKVGFFGFFDVINDFGVAKALLDTAVNWCKEKNLDAIVLNSLNDEGAGFGQKTNKISFLDKNSNLKTFAIKAKSDVAVDIW